MKHKRLPWAENIFENFDTTIPNDRMIKFIENMNYFFLATSSKDGKVNVNFKGTKSKILIKFLDNNRFIFPDFNGNGILHLSAENTHKRRNRVTTFICLAR